MSYLVGPSQDQRTRTVSSLFVYVFFFSFSILLLVADADDARQTASGYLLTRWTRLHDNQQAIRTDRAEFHLQRVREIDEQVFLLLLLLYYDGQKETAGGQSSLQSYNRFPFSFFFFFFFLLSFRVIMFLFGWEKVHSRWMLANSIRSESRGSSRCTFGVHSR